MQGRLLKMSGEFFSKDQNNLAIFCMDLAKDLKKEIEKDLTDHKAKYDSEEDTLWDVIESESKT